MTLEVRVTSNIPIIETHQHLSEAENPDRTFGWTGNRPEGILAAMRANYVACSILQPLGGAVDPIAVHREIAHLADRHPGHFFGIASLNVKEHGELNTARELETCVQDLGFVGIKLHGFSHGISPCSPLGRLYFDAAARLKVPLVACVGAHGMPFTNPGLYAEMAAQYPEVKVVFAHLDYPIAEEAAAIARRLQNVYLSSSLSIPAYLRVALRQCGPEKLMLASEDSDSITAEIAKFTAIGATDEQVEQMLCRTPLDVFGLHGRAASLPP